ncbi:MAG: SAM-dependent chlorinase/fluorinase [Bacteroidota bacterium]
MAIITLTTDFGTKDHFVAAIKGRILSQVPETTIVDISHGISPFDVHECAYILKCTFSEFPKGSIHIIGLESEWSPENEHVLVLIEGHYFIGADNGILSIITSEIKPEKINRIALPQMEPSPFPELEVFTKVACHLARGGKIEVVSKPLNQLKEVKVIAPRVSNNGATMTGNVIYIDHYGNVVTSITKTLFEAYRNGRAFEVIARSHKLTTIFNTYSELIDFELPKNQRKGASDFLALFNSAGHLELSIFKSDLKTVGGASSLIGLKHQDIVTINFL